MAKVVITIEDYNASGSNAVRVTSDPSNADLFRKISSHGTTALSPAEAYAAYALRMVREKSKETESSIIVPVPRIGR